MGEHTKIQWAHHTFNPWRGCTKVSAGCDHRYAESGPGARPFDIQWARDTIAQCRAAGMPVFVKQLGAQPRRLWGDPENPPESGLIGLRDRKGGDPTEWSEDLRVREYPEMERTPT